MSASRRLREATDAPITIPVSCREGTAEDAERVVPLAWPLQVPTSPVADGYVPTVPKEQEEGEIVFFTCVPC